MQRLSDLKGMHLREISSGLPFAFKEETELLRNAVLYPGKAGASEAQVPEPREGSSQAVLCKSGFIDSDSVQAKKGSEGE